MSGYFASGVNFDDLFDFYVQGGQAPACGFTTPDGRDLSARYAPLAVGQKRADVGFSGVQGYDVSNLWAAKGTATYSLGFNGGNYARSALALTNQQGTVAASVGLAINSDGTWVITSSSTREGGRTEASGTWLPAGGNVGDYEVQFGVATSQGGGGSISNSAPSYQNLGASRTVGISASARAASTENIDHSIHVVCYLRRISTGHTTVTSCSMRAMATGWV